MKAPLEQKPGMLERTINFSAQVAEALALCESMPLPSWQNNFSNVVVLGMGASGIAGDFLRVMLRNLPLPIYVNKHSIAPRFVDERTLVLAITYSGKTEETLSALEGCSKRGAKIVCITGSGELRSICEHRRIACIRTGENGASRASLGYILIPALYVLQRMDLLPRVTSEINESVKVLDEIRAECGPDIQINDNPAKSIALKLLDKHPVIYGEYNFTEVAALRWKQQFNENSKVRAYYDIFPELLHNEIEAWDSGHNHEDCSLILLRDLICEREAGIEEKVEALKCIVTGKHSEILDVWSRGRSELARLLSLAYLGDLTSIYLAVAQDVDPFPVRYIESVKALGAGGG